MIEIITVILCAICKFVGELWQHNAQRFIMPLILCVAFSAVSNVWWLGLTVLPVIGPICLGYKFYGDNDALARGLWLFVIGIFIGIGSVYFNHLSLLFYIPYIIVCGAWGSTTRNLPNFIIAPFTGALLGSIIFFVR